MNEPVTVIIPAYNEESSIGDTIEKVEMVLTQSQIPHEVIVVDDGSTDQTFSVSQPSGARVIRHEKNRGYGAALKTGIRAAQYELIIITDADGTYPVDRIPEILNKLQTADMVVGARVSQNVDIPLVRRPAKWILKRLSEYITGYRIPDLNSGLRGFRCQFLEQYFSVLPEKFSFTTTLTVAMLCDNYKITYVPIDYYKRLGKSKIVPWDFVNFVTLVLRLSMLFNPLKVFVPISSICFLLGGFKLLFDVGFAIVRAEKLTFSILIHPVVSTTTLILLLFGLQILLLGMLSDGIARKIEQLMPSGYRSRVDRKVDEQYVKRPNEKKP
jgi:glycosyltransferase involved in cell wall biosynthesis